MKTKFSLAIMALALMFTACNQQTDKKTETTEVKEQKAVEITPDEFIANAEKYVDQKVIIKGAVSHICKHGGKRLFLLNEKEDNTLKIEAGDGIAQFDATCEGGSVSVAGIVKELRIDEDYLMEKEAALEGEKKEAEGEHQHAEGEHKQGEGDGHGAHGHDMAANLEEAHSSEMEQINNLREKIKASGKGYISNFWIEGTSYEVLAAVKTENKEEVK